MHTWTVSTSLSIAPPRKAGKGKAVPAPAFRAHTVYLGIKILQEGARQETGGFCSVLQVLRDLWAQRGHLHSRLHFAHILTRATPAANSHTQYSPLIHGFSVFLG